MCNCACAVKLGRYRDTTKVYYRYRDSRIFVAIIELSILLLSPSYTPGRGKIVLRNIITLLVGEKLCRVM